MSATPLPAVVGGFLKDYGVQGAGAGMLLVLALVVGYYLPERDAREQESHRVYVEGMKTQAAESRAMAEEYRKALHEQEGRFIDALDAQAERLLRFVPNPNVPTTEAPDEQPHRRPR